MAYTHTTFKGQRIAIVQSDHPAVYVGIDPDTGDYTEFEDPVWFGEGTKDPAPAQIGPHPAEFDIDYEPWPHLPTA